MNKRPAVDLSALTAHTATAMPEAQQRAPQPPANTDEPPRKAAQKGQGAKTENLEALAFKVPAAFRKRFKQRALGADLKLNELLFEALEAWEERKGVKK